MKEKSLFEQKGIGYTEYNGVLIPNVVMPKSKNYQLGKFGKLHKKWLKENHKSIYTIKLMKGELDSYIADVDKRATEMYDNLVKQLAEKEGITEQLKANDMITWVKAMNNISNRSREIVCNKIVYYVNWFMSENHCVLAHVLRRLLIVYLLVLLCLYHKFNSIFM